MDIRINNIYLTHHRLVIGINYTNVYGSIMGILPVHLHSAHLPVKVQRSREGNPSFPGLRSQWWPEPGLRCRFSDEQQTKIAHFISPQLTILCLATKVSIGPGIKQKLLGPGHLLVDTRVTIRWRVWHSRWGWPGSQVNITTALLPDARAQLC